MRYLKAFPVAVTISTVAMGLFALSCSEPNVTVNLNVTVSSNQGDPVAEAEIFLAGKSIGKSDNEGKFRSSLSAVVGSRQELKIKKESETYYFAPFHESFLVIDKNPQEVGVGATLYFVPKPGSNTDIAAAPKEEPKSSSSGIVEEEIPAESSSEDPDSQSDELLAEESLSDMLDSMLSDESGSSDTPGDDSVDLQLTTIPPVTETITVYDYPKAPRTESSTKIFTVHVHTGDRPVDSAQVFVGNTTKSDLKKVCESNARGRCPIRFSESEAGPTTLVIKREGFRTKTVKATLRDKGQQRVALVRGQTIDIFAITKTYNFTRGLEGVAVFVEGKQVGRTDKFGHYSYSYTGQKDDLVAIRLKSRNYLPESFETDFVASGPMTLVRYFSPTKAPPAKVTLVMAQAAGRASDQDFQRFDDDLNRSLRRSARKHLLASAAFREFPFSSFSRVAKGKSLGDLVLSGWEEEDLKSQVDALLVPTIVMKDAPELQLSFVDSSGKVIAAAKEKLDSLNDKGSVDRTMAIIAKKIIRTFPFEGTVTSTKGELATINIGKNSGRGLYKGTVLEAYGMHHARSGRNQSHKRIARLQVTSVGDRTSQARVLNLEPRSTLGRGDLIKVKARPTLRIRSTQIRVTAEDNAPVAQANVYSGDDWLGATNDEGRLYIDAKKFDSNREIQVIRHGYSSLQKRVALGKAKIHRFTLKRQSAFVRIESQPSGVEVRFDGRVIGKTPISTPVSIPSGFVKLELEAPSGYKSFERVLELERGTLDLTGINAIQLERDIRSEAKRLLAAGRPQQAVEKLEDIPESHSDYLLSRHEAGEIFLTMLNRPADAAKAFGEVTKKNAVKQFADKRFIGSHINEGIALFMTGEELEDSQPQAAAEHYKKAIEVLDGVAPQLRFVPADQYSKAVNNVGYHKALSRHRLWQQTRNSQVLGDTVRSWRQYLDQGSKGDASSKYIDNAKVYYKQAQASYAALQSAEAPD